MANHRDSITIPIRVSSMPQLDRCLRDRDLRIMVFCAAANTGIQDIAFPHQCEMKVNGDDVKVNMRGLKNKPGSTRPVDITDYLRLKPPGYNNNLEFIFALTTKEGDPSPFLPRSQEVCKAKYDPSTLANRGAGTGILLIVVSLQKV